MKMSAEFEEELGTKSFDDIVADTLQALEDADNDLTNIEPGSVIRTLVEALAENEDTSNYYIEYIYNCLNIENCTGDDLDRAAKILSLVREPAKCAVSTLTLFTGEEPAQYDIDIPYGYVVSTRPDSNGEVKEFTITDAGKVLKAGEFSIDVTITANDAGYMYVPANGIVVMSTSLQGISSVSNQNAINGGKDAESDEEFIERIHNVQQTFGKCTDDAIQSAVSQLGGVTKATVYDMYDGVGTTGVMIITDTVPAPESVKKAIEETVASTKASGIRADIIYATTKVVDINMSITGCNINSDTISKILEAINKYCLSLGIGQSLLVRQLERKILNALDTTEAENDNVDITMIAPSENVSVNTDEIIRTGTITINDTVVS